MARANRNQPDLAAANWIWPEAAMSSQPDVENGRLLLDWAVHG